MPNDSCASVYVFCNCNFFRTLDHRVNLHFQCGKSFSMQWNALCVHRLGCGSEEESCVLSFWTVLVIFLIIQELRDRNWDVSVRDCIDMRVLVLFALEQRRGRLKSGVLQFLQRNHLPLWFNMFGSFDTDNFACVAADSGVHALQCKEQDFISRRSNQCMHWMCDKILALLYCMFRAFRPFHNTQRNNHDGNHR